MPSLIMDGGSSGKVGRPGGKSGKKGGHGLKISLILSYLYAIVKLLAIYNWNC